MTSKGFKTLFYMALTFVMAVVLVPFLYFVSLSLYSEYEAYDFPLSFVPKTNFNLKFEYADVDGVDEYTVYVKNKKVEGNWDKVIVDDDPSDILKYLQSKLSLKISEEKLNTILETTKENGVYEVKIRKDLLYNYKNFFEIQTGAFDAFINSLKVAFMTIIISVTIGALAGYSFARYIFKGKDVIKVTTLIVKMFPVVAISVSMATILAQMGMYDTMLGLAIVYSVPSIALTTWITTAIFVNLSPELEEASLVFGAGKIKTFFKITLPLALPGLAASSMYAFLAAWNDTITALILTTSSNSTLGVLVYKMLVGGTSIQITATGAMILTIPALIFTFLVKDYAQDMWG